MTEERAIYKSFMVEAGLNYDEAWDKVAAGEEVGGKVWMCTFPGLSRMILQDGLITHVSVVKASVQLEGTLKILRRSVRERER